MRAAAFIALLVSCAAVSPVLGQPRPEPPPSAAVQEVIVTARRPTVVAGVTVTGYFCPSPNPAKYASDHNPEVTGSFPAQGAQVPPGAIYVQVRFSQPMTCDWDVTITGGDKDPCAAAGAWALPGRRSFVTRCSLAASTHYVFHFARSEGYGFVGLSGRTAAPFDLAFDTTDAPPTPAAAPLTDRSPQAAEKVSAFVTCLDSGEDESDRRACRRAVVDAGSPDMDPRP